MHGPSFTLDEIAARVERQYVELRELGTIPDRAFNVLAERHDVPVSTVVGLVVRHRRREGRRRQATQAAA